MDVKEDNYRKKMHLGQDGNALVNLLVLNAVMFVVLKFIFVFFQLTQTGVQFYNSRICVWAALSYYKRLFG